MMGLYYLINANADKDWKGFFKKALILLLPVGIMIFWIVFRLKMFGLSTETL